MKKNLLNFGIIGMIVGIILATMTEPGAFQDATPKSCFSDKSIIGTPKQCDELKKHFDRVNSAGYANNKKELPTSRIFHDYLSNQVAAREKYHNKALMVTGTVAAVQTDMLGYPSIMLNTYYQFSFVKMELADIHFSKNNKLISPVEKSAQLRSGDVIHAVCFGDDMIAGTPILEDCVLQ